MAKVLKNIGSYLFNKLRDKVFLLCLLVSTSLLIVNKLSLEYSHIVTVPVVITGAVSDYDSDLIAGDEKVYYINLIARAKGIYFVMLSFKNRVVISPDELEFERYSEDSDLFKIDITSMHEALIAKMPNFVIDAVLNKSVVLQTTSFSQKKVPLVSSINVKREGEYMQVGNVIFEPDSVTIYGSKNVLDTVKSIQTDYLYVRQASEFMTGSVKIARNDSYEVTPREASYVINMGRYTEIDEVVEVSVLNGGEKVDGYSMYPKKVSIKLNVTQSSYSNFDIDDIDFYVDLSKNRVNKQFVSKRYADDYVVYHSPLPDGVEVVSISPLSITLFKNSVK